MRLFNSFYMYILSNKLIMIFKVAFAIFLAFSIINVDSAATEGFSKFYLRGNVCKNQEVGKSLLFSNLRIPNMYIFRAKISY